MQNTIGTELEVIPRSTIAPADAPGWGRARHWLNIAVHFEFRRVVAQVMVGFEVMALHEELGVQKGGDRAKCQSGTLLFKLMIENELSIPSRTAYRWMQMAKQVRDEAGKVLDAGEVLTLLERPVRGWTSDNCSAVFDYVARITAGKTQAQLLAAGKRRQKYLTREKVLLGTQAAGREAGQEWNELQARLKEYGSQFTLIPDAAIERQMEVLELMLTARDAWLKYEPKLRTKENAMKIFDDVGRQLVYLRDLERKRK